MSKQDICHRLPHSGNMCLLDDVLFYDEGHIRCLSNTHLNPDNPLRNTQGLSSYSGIEYAAQAMAVHSSLLQNRHFGQKGYLAALRNIKITQQYLDQQQMELIIAAKLFGATKGGAIYSFSLNSAETEIISGRATIINSEVLS